MQQITDNPPHHFTHSYWLSSNFLIKSPFSAVSCVQHLKRYWSISTKNTGEAVNWKEEIVLTGFLPCPQVCSHEYSCLYKSLVNTSYNILSYQHINLSAYKHPDTLSQVQSNLMISNMLIRLRLENVKTDFKPKALSIRGCALTSYYCTDNADRLIFTHNSSRTSSWIGKSCSTPLRHSQQSE